MPRAHTRVLADARHAVAAGGALEKKHAGGERRWIQVDQTKLKAVTHGGVWTLTADDLVIKKDCLDSLGIPFTVRRGAVKKLSVVSGAAA